MAILINKTRQIEVLSNLEKADSFMSRLKGLLGKESIESGFGLMIEPCNSIHCFFMKFPIDVAFVGKDNTVLKIISEMKPFTASPIIFGAKFVIEAKATEFKDILFEGDTVDII